MITQKPMQRCFKYLSLRQCIHSIYEYNTFIQDFQQMMKMIRLLTMCFVKSCNSLHNFSLPGIFNNHKYVK